MLNSIKQILASKSLQAPDGRPLYAYTTDDYWIDLGNPEAYLAAHRHIFDNSMPLDLVPEVDGPGRDTIPASAVRAPIFVGIGCRVAPDAVVGPYTVLGDNCEIGPGAVVADGHAERRRRAVGDPLRR